MGGLKQKIVDKTKVAQAVKEKEAAFKATYGREPMTDSEIDQVYGAGAATRAMDEFYEKMGKK
jgi:hypothetical protein